MGKKLTEQEIITRFIEKHDLCRYGYSKINYQGTKKKVHIYCQVCKKYFWQTPDNHLEGKGCRECGYKKNGTQYIKSEEQFILEAIEKHCWDFNYKVSIYNGTNNKLDIICLKCNKVFSQSPKRHLQGDKCPYCAKNRKKTFQEIKLLVEYEKYTVLTSKKDYLNSTSSLQLCCPENHIWETSWNNFQSGSRCSLCYRLDNFGENHPNWKGGISLEPYCGAWADKQYKSDIRKRDSNTCQNPYCYKTDKRLHIHHIDYKKKNCYPSNLITVCGSCNARANKDREWHTEWYQVLLKNKLTYVKQD